VSADRIVVAKGSVSHIKELAERCQQAGIDVSLDRCCGQS
jgi:hypothetical protein